MKKEIISNEYTQITIFMNVIGIDSSVGFIVWRKSKYDKVMRNEPFQHQDIQGLILKKISVLIMQTVALLIDMPI